MAARHPVKVLSLGSNPRGGASCGRKPRSTSKSKNNPGWYGAEFSAKEHSERIAGV